jgi:hypothetical protein
MSGHVRISDEKDARWHKIQHRIRMDHLRHDAERLRIAEERDRVMRRIARADRCPHCGHTIDPQSSKP